MEKLWLKNYPAGVPAEIDASQFRSLAQLLEESFRTYADRRAFICMDHAITYGELDQLSHAFAAWLQSRGCLLYTSPSPRDATLSRMPSSA